MCYLIKLILVFFSVVIDGTGELDEDLDLCVLMHNVTTSSWPLMSACPCIFEDTMMSKCQVGQALFKVDLNILLLSIASENKMQYCVCRPRPTCSVYYCKFDIVCSYFCTVYQIYQYHITIYSK